MSFRDNNRMKAIEDEAARQSVLLSAALSRLDALETAFAAMNAPKPQKPPKAA
jgi:hypothetical protein